MFDFLFGEGQYGMRFLFAFIVVLGLIALTTWLVRRFGGDRLGAATGRGRQPRLAVIDAAAVDGRRRLILIRRGRPPPPSRSRGQLPLTWRSRRRSPGRNSSSTAAAISRCGRPATRSAWRTRCSKWRPTPWIFRRRLPSTRAASA